MLLQERDVLEEELFLEVLGAGGDDDALAGEDGGDQIGERLAGAGAGFDDEVALVGEGGFDGFGHFELAGAELVIRVPLRKRAAAGEELAHGGRLGGSRTSQLVRLWREGTLTQRHGDAGRLGDRARPYAFAHHAPPRPRLGHQHEPLKRGALGVLFPSFQSLTRPVARWVAGEDNLTRPLPAGGVADSWASRPHRHKAQLVDSRMVHLSVTPAGEDLGGLMDRSH